MPADLTGAPLFRSDHGDCAFAPGPVFAELALVDEINRAPPKVRPARLEAMAEGRVTIGGATHPPPDPFMVVVTWTSSSTRACCRRPRRSSTVSRCTWRRPCPTRRRAATGRRCSTRPRRRRCARRSTALRYGAARSGADRPPAAPLESGALLTPERIGGAVADRTRPGRAGGARLATPRLARSDAASRVVILLSDETNTAATTSMIGVTRRIVCRRH